MVPLCVALLKDSIPPTMDRHLCEMREGFLGFHLEEE